MAIAKAKIRARHKRAIDNFLKWRDDNPNAARKRRVAEFDACVDSEALKVEIAMAEKRSKVKVRAS